MEASLTELNNAIEMLAPKDPFIEEKKTPEGIIIQQSSSLSAASSGVTGPMSEKQKVRLLMEKKCQRENEYGYQCTQHRHMHDQLHQIEKTKWIIESILVEDVFNIYNLFQMHTNWLHIPDEIWCMSF